MDEESVLSIFSVIWAEGKRRRSADTGREEVKADQLGCQEERHRPISEELQIKFK